MKARRWTVHALSSGRLSGPGRQDEGGRKARPYIKKAITFLGTGRVPALFRHFEAPLRRSWDFQDNNTGGEEIF
jgi:hypothetical protein